MVIAAVVIGLVVGALGTLLALRPLLVRGRAHEGEAGRLRDELRNVERTLAATEASLEAERGALGDRVASAVQKASSDALQQSSEAFLSLAHTKLDAYVAPLRQSLDKVETHVGALELARKEAYGALNEGVRLLRADQERLRAETGNLVTALRAPHVRGRWGEIQLKRVIEMAGMLEYCDFDEQHTVTSDEGRMLRPDVVVRLPGGKSVVIDSKVPLTAYLDAMRDDLDEPARGIARAEHARHVREHAQKLGQKAYWRQFANTPDFVVMFLPDEAFYRVALDHDPGLLEAAFASNVIVASPTNLIGLLRAVAYGWQQETLAENAREIGDLGRDLYRRLSTMGTHVAKLGKALDKAVSVYNETVGSLERQVMSQARKFERHGIGGIEPPDLEPVERRARQLTAAELVDAAGTSRTESAQRALELPTALELEVVSGDAA